jgi:hypothetical protein
MAARGIFGRHVAGLVAAGVTAATVAAAGPAFGLAASGGAAAAAVAGGRLPSGRAAALTAQAQSGELRALRGPSPIASAHGSRLRDVRAVTVSARARGTLLHLYASHLGVPPGDIAGFRPGTLHAAYQGPAGTEWASASFLPSLTAPASVKVRFQDAASTVVFSRSGGRGWQIARAGGEPLGCPGVLPASIARAWRLASNVGCPAGAPVGNGSPWQQPMIPDGPSPAAIVQTATLNVGVGDRPASTNFSFDCNPYTTLVGVGATHHHCRRNLHFAVKNQNELWCADFAKWVWEQAGVTTDLPTLTPAASSFYAWGKQQGESMPTDSASPAVGDAVVFYPSNETPGASYADHVGLVTSVNPDGTVNLVNGDFAGPSNITVQESTNVSLATWAAAIWGRGEKWAFVSPIPAPPSGQARTR